MSPTDAILWVLDKIFDFLDFDDLENAALVWKFFCYTATMDKLYAKFDLDNLSTDSHRNEIKDNKDEKKWDSTSIGKPTTKTGHKSNISAGSTFNRTDTARLTKE